MKTSRPIWIAVGMICLGAQLMGRAQSAATNLWALQVSNFGCDSSPAIALDGTMVIRQTLV